VYVARLNGPVKSSFHKPHSHPPGSGSGANASVLTSEKTIHDKNAFCWNKISFTVRGNVILWIGYKFTCLTSRNDRKVSWYLTNIVDKMDLLCTFNFTYKNHKEKSKTSLWNSSHSSSLSAVQGPDRASLWRSSGAGADHISCRCMNLPQTNNPCVLTSLYNLQICVNRCILTFNFVFRQVHRGAVGEDVRDGADAPVHQSGGYWMHRHDCDL